MPGTNFHSSLFHIHGFHPWLTSFHAFGVLLRPFIHGLHPWLLMFCPFRLCCATSWLSFHFSLLTLYSSLTWASWPFSGISPLFSACLKPLRSRKCPGPGSDL